MRVIYFCIIFYYFIFIFSFVISKLFTPICIIVILYLHAHCKRPCGSYLANECMYRVTGKTCLGGGMHCPSASSFVLFWCRIVARGASSDRAVKQC